MRNDPMEGYVCPYHGYTFESVSYDGENVYCDGCEKWISIYDAETVEEYQMNQHTIENVYESAYRDPKDMEG